jgi:predicted nucleotidyltransferase
MDKAYTIDEIREMIRPIVKKHNIPAIYLFGSYARGDATSSSDIDFIIDKAGSRVKSLFDMVSVLQDFEAQFGEDNVDLVTLQALYQDDNRKNNHIFIGHVEREMKRVL